MLFRLDSRLRGNDREGLARMAMGGTGAVGALEAYPQESPLTG
jgi:hypothetical protein